MPSRWLDWPNTPRIIEKDRQNELTKPTEPGFVGFVGSQLRTFSITRLWRKKLPIADPYAERMQAALREINRPEYGVGTNQ